MIDKNGRAKYLEETKNKSLVSGLKDSIVSALQTQNSSNPNEEVLKLVVKREEDQKLQATVDKLGSALALIYKQISKPLSLPKVLQVKGDVEVTNQLKVSNLSDLSKYFSSLEQTINNISLAIRSIPPATMEAPKIVLPSNPQPAVDLSGVTQAIQNLEESLQKVTSSDDQLRVLRLVQNAVERLADKPQYIPPAVTNIDINGLQGFSQSSTTTVKTTPTPLPGYGQLFNRRSMIIFNNSSQTLYLGGSGVTTANGLPILTQSFSPAIDAGYDLVVYGIVASSTADVRVLEISKDQTANIQE